MTLPSGAARSAQAVVAGFGLFTAGYYALFQMGAPVWLADAALLLPAGAALLLTVRRARASDRGRPGLFWKLIAAGLGLWLLGSAAWVGAELLGFTSPGGRRPVAGAVTAFYSWTFLGFLLPIVAAVALRPRLRGVRRDALAWVDASLLAGAVSFVFVRLVFVPVFEGSALRWRIVLGLLSYVVAVWSALLWRSAEEDPEWRRAFGYLALFALSYGGLDSLASGFDYNLLPPGGPADLAFILPFLFLALATLPARPGGGPLATSPLVVLLAGAGPPVFDLALRVLLPPLGLAHPPRPILLVVTCALLALGCALRLRLEDRAEERRAREERARAEESRRGVRLQTLAAISASAMEELEQASRELVRRAEAAAADLEEKGERALEQAQRAHGIVREMSAAFRLSSRPPHQDVDLAAVLESAVRIALDEGVALHVRLEGTARVPRVLGDAVALEASFLHLIRNAAQASPGGVLGILAEADEHQVLIRFEDDGPGVPAEIRSRIFDPFFTTRRVGEGLGLGLTLVHFVARDHGGSIVLEPSAPGATTFVLRLPLRAPRTAEAEGRWPMSAAVLASAGAATLLALLPAGTGQIMAASLALQVGSALAAAAALLYAAWRSSGPVRVFWAVLAGAPGIWAAVRFLRVMEGAPSHAPVDSVWHFAGYALADLVWAAALLIRPDRTKPSRASVAGLLTRMSAFCLFAHAYVYLVVFPSPFAELDGALAVKTALLRGLARLALASWAFLLSWRTLSADWQGTYSRLGLCLAAAGVGQSLAGMARLEAGYQVGALTDLGWIVPALLLAAVAVGEGRRRAEAIPPAAEAEEPSWDAAVLLGLLVLPALEVLTGPTPHAALHALRHSATLATLAVVGTMLAVREVMRPRERWFRPATGRLPGTGTTSSSRLLRLVGTALFELSGHLSGITALARLLTAQSDVSTRVRSDAARIRERADAATRISRNLIAALAGEGATPELASPNRLVDEVIAQRRADLAHESIRLEAELSPEVPLTWLQMPALRQVLLSCVDNAAVAIRSTGRPGLIELATAVEANHVVIRIRDDGPGLPKAALRLLVEGAGDRRASADLGLTLGYEIVSQHGGTLTGRNRARGGAEITVRLPVVSAAAVRDRLAASAR
jgi:signal transduction histidine kinase